MKSTVEKGPHPGIKFVMLDDHQVATLRLDIDDVAAYKWHAYVEGDCIGQFRAVKQAHEAVEQEVGL